MNARMGGKTKYIHVVLIAVNSVQVVYTVAGEICTRLINYRVDLFKLNLATARIQFLCAAAALHEGVRSF